MYNLNMHIFINFLIILFYLVIITITYFLIEKIRNSDFVVKLNVHNTFMDFAEGAMHSAFTILFQLWLYQTHQVFIPYLFIVIGITMSFLRGPIVGSYSIFYILIYTMFFFSINTIDFYYILGITFLIMAISSISRNFFDIKISVIITSVTIIVNVVIFWLIHSFVLNNKFNIKVVMATLIPFVLSILLISLISYFVLFFRSANILYESSTYDYGKFYRESYATVFMGNHIKTNNIKNAFFVMLGIKWNVKNTALIKELEKKLLDKTELITPSSALLFKVNKTNYGFLLKNTKKLDIETMIKNNKNKKPSNDQLAMIKNIVEELSCSYYSKDGKSAKANVYAGVTIYGIQDSSLSAMRRNVEFVLKIIEWNEDWNKVSLFDPAVWRKNIQNTININQLRNDIEISFVSHEYLPMFNLETKKTVFNVAKPVISEGGHISLDVMRKYSEEVGMIDLLDKYIAAKAIIGTNKFNKTKIAIRYSAIIISSQEFSGIDFISGIKRFSQSPSNIVIVFQAQLLQSLKENVIFQKNINKLKESGIAISVENCDSLKMLKSLKWIELDTVFLRTKIFEIKELKLMVKYCKMESIDLVASEISNEEELRKVIKSQIKIIGGRIFNKEEVYPKLFNQKNHFYLESIKK